MKPNPETMKIISKIDLARQLVESGISEEARAALEREFPELKESEDERIRKFIYGIILNQKKIVKNLVEDNGNELYKIDKALDWLERQKEQKPAETSNIDLDTKVNDWIGYTLNNNAQSYSKKDVQIMLDNCARFFYDYAVMCLDKPAEWSDNFEENIRELLHNKLTWHSEDGTMSSTVLIDDKTLKDIISGIWFYVGKEALKYPSKETNVTEWSEEDRKHLDWIIEHFRQGCGLYDALIYWLEQLPKRFNLPPKQEWSEEDKTNGWTGVDLERYLSCLQKLGTGNPLQPETINSKWFKEHCRPRHITYALDAPLCYDNDMNPIYPPINHWKPSEEQIYSLGTVVNGYDNCTVGSVGYNLKELYEQLKKLI